MDLLVSEDEFIDEVSKLAGQAEEWRVL